MAWCLWKIILPLGDFFDQHTIKIIPKSKLNYLPNGKQI